ncbi:MAG: folylpolyglutamate synthase/dihydrofolate synthase family protein [Planctomycetota bacterium]
MQAPATDSSWTFDDAEAWLDARVDFERRPATTPDALKLDRMRALAAALGDPQDRVPAIHVAGSKGKGSITRMAASILSAAGLKTGAFTSPHLVSVRERIAIGGEPIDPGGFARAARGVAAVEDRVAASHGTPTYFECVTAMAMRHFAESDCDAAVLEVGLGGRLDCTNIVTPRACVLGAIELEHTRILGDTLEAVAGEKAGILKPGVPAVCVPQSDAVLGVFRGVAGRVGARLLVIGEDIEVASRMDGGHAAIDLAIHGRALRDLRAPLPGAHQASNAAAAVAACLLFEPGLTETQIRAGLERTPRDGRMEVVSRDPIVVVDGAHTPLSVRALMATLRTEFGGGRTVVVFGCAADKDIDGMLREFADAGVSLVLTRAAGGPRAMPVEGLADRCRHTGTDFEAAEPVAAAIERARKMAGARGLVCACGSYMVAGAAKMAARASR